MSEYESEATTPARSYIFDSSFESHNAAYVALNINLDHEGAPRKYTPFQSVSDFNEILYEDTKSRESFISCKCKKCDSYIGINELNDHLTLHSSLKKLCFKEMPKNIDELIKRRRLLIKSTSITNISHAADVSEMKILEWDTKVKHINDAYEIVKSHLDGSFYTTNKIRKTIGVDTLVESKLSINPSITSIGMSLNQNKAKRKQMEAANVIIESFGQNINKTYIGLFDGYDGNVSSTFCSKQLHLALLKNISKFDKTVNFIKTEDALEDEINNMEKYEIVNKIESTHESRRSKHHENDDDDEQFKAYLNNIKSAFYNAYKQMDKLLSRGRNEKSKTRWSGATSVTSIIENIENKKTWIHVANCGDVEALLIMNNNKEKRNATSSRKYKLLTSIHTIKRNSKERERLEKADCHIIETETENPKIGGLYEITRSLGLHGDVDVKKFILNVPSVRSVELDENCACIVIATKGLWKFLDYETVSDLVLQMLPSNNIVMPVKHDKYVESLIKKARKVGDKEEKDDVGDDKPPTPELIQQFLEISRSTFVSKDDVVNEKINMKESEASDDKNSVAKSFFEEEEQRPQTLPDEYLNKDLKTNYDDSFKVYSATKSNSDIFPLNKGQTSATKKQNDDIRFNEQPMTIEDYTKHLLSSINKNNSMLSKLSVEVELFAKKLLKDTSNEITQVNTHDIEKEFRKYMDKAVRFKLDITDEISKRLVNSALHAGSDENILINCILLPSSCI